MKTIILLHGWDNKNYTKYGCTDAWSNRNDFVVELSKHFNVVKLNFPGFCGEPEPSKIWGLNDYASNFQQFLLSRNLSPDIVLGYSFGAAVAVKWKSNYSNHIKLVLVSPAIARAYKTKNKITKFNFIKVFIPKALTTILRDYYLKKIGNRFYTDGTKFLKGSYLNIVKVDLSDDLRNLDSNELTLIFGSDDTATPPQILLDKTNDTPIKDRVFIIPGGSHNIGQTHFKEIVNLIITRSENNSTYS